MTIALTAGGTGGHVFPALSLAEKLAELGHEVHLFTDSRGLKYQKSYGIEKVICLPIQRNKGVSGSIQFIVSLMIATLKCFFQFIVQRPQVVVGFGGYVSAPAILAAYMLRIKTILHEQNAVLGRLNRKVAPYVSYLATSFPEVRYAEALNPIMTGNPVRPEFITIGSQPFPSHNSKLKIFVVGGSQGAAVFSRVIPEAIASLRKEERDCLEIVQQCRPELMDDTVAAYSKIKFPVQLQSFFSDMDQKISQSHLVIARAGAMTVTELVTSGRPGIFVPYGAAMDNHQYYNAYQVIQTGGGWLIKEKEFTPSALVNILRDILSNPKQLKEKADRIRHFAIPEASTNLAKLVQDLLPSK